jgi:hypothetical protein
MATTTNEHLMNKTSELSMSTEYATTELKRVRVDHDQAIANLAENMNKWNDTIRYSCSSCFLTIGKTIRVGEKL